MRLCALVLSDDDRVLKVLEALSPDVIYLAYRGRGLLRHGERLRRLGEVRVVHIFQYRSRRALARPALCRF